MSKLIELIKAGKLAEAKTEFESMMDERVQKNLEEKRKVVVKVTSKGVRRKKLMCGKGMVAKDGKCVPQTSGEKLTRKKAARLAIKTKKAAGAGAKRKANILRQKAKKKRKGMGLKT